MRLELSRDQARIVLQLLEWHIENLVDEPEDSPRAQECKEAEELFNQLYDALASNRS